MQCSAPLSGGSGPGFIEPVPAFYRRLSDACQQVSETLASYAMLPTQHAWSLAQLGGQLDAFAGYADKIVAGQSLSTEEQYVLNRFGAWLTTFFSGQGVKENTSVTVADVATDANTERVLHEGVGLFNPLVIICEPPAETPWAGLGYVMSHYEFALPDYERMTDAAWQTQIISGTSPARAAWMTALLDQAER